jgi:hypothetical protein
VPSSDFSKRLDAQDEFCGMLRREGAYGLIRLAEVLSRADLEGVRGHSAVPPTPTAVATEKKRPVRGRPLVERAIDGGLKISSFLGPRPVGRLLGSELSGVNACSS